jgi:hypothetical protein
VRSLSRFPSGISSLDFKVSKSVHVKSLHLRQNRVKVVSVQSTGDGRFYNCCPLHWVVMCGVQGKQMVVIIFFFRFCLSVFLSSSSFFFPL